MIPVLFKKNEQQFRSYGLGPIHDIISPKVTRERNGQYLLYFQYPQDAEFADVFEEDMRIKSDAGVRTKWQTFEISRVVRKEGQLIEVFAKHISQSLLKDALNPSVSVRSLNAEQALRIWNNNRIGDEEFDVWSDISTTSSTNWDIRDVSNAFEALAGVQGSILDVWGGEYEFDNKLIRLHKEMGRKSPVPLEYGRNITGLEQDQQEDNVYTSVYPFATYTAEGDNQPKTVTLPERYIDGKYLEFHNKRKIQVVDFSGEFESDDIPTVSRLRTLTENYLKANEVGLPHENLKVEYIDLSKTLDYQEFQTMEEVELNDRLPIFYPKFGITNENAKVVVINYDPVKEENISIELGVIGQSFRTVTTGGLGSRLDRVEKQQDATNNYIVNAKGNRIWFETPDENMEHKIGDTWFEKNGPYDRIRVWNGSQWEVIIDSEDIDKNAKAIAAQQQKIEDAREVADEAVDSINTAVSNAGFTSLDDTIKSVQSRANTAFDTANDLIGEVSDYSLTVDGFNQTVNNYTNQVANFRSDVNGFSSTVASYSADVRGYATQVSTLNNTVNGFNSTVANIDGRVTSLSTTVNGISSTVSGLGGRVSAVEQTAAGLQTTVASKADQTQVTQLSNAYNIFVGGIESKKNLLPGMEPGSISSYSGDEYSISGYVRSPYIPVEPNSYYIASLDGNSVSFAIYSYSDIGQFVSASSMNASYKPVGANVKYIRVVVYNSNPDLKYQLEKGFAVTDYVPFIGDVSSAQISMLQNNINLRVTSTELNNAIGGKADKNQLITQINLSPDTALIQSSNILLDGNVTIRGTAWMDGAVLKNLSVDGAKLQDATIGSAKIANLDVNKISGNITEFVRTSWNNINDSVQIDGSGITMVGNNIYRKNVNNAEGINLYGDYGAYRKAGAIGYFRTDINTRDKNANVIDVGPNHEHYIGMAANRGYSLVLGFGVPSSGDRIYRRSVVVSGDTGTVTMFGSLSMRNLDGISWIGGGSNIHEVNQHLEIRSKGRLRLYNSINSLKAEFGAGLDMYGDINMHNNNIYNNSDVRLKKEYNTDWPKVLDAIKQWDFVDYEWRDEEFKGTFMGVIAQDTPEIASYNEETGFYAINSSKQLMMTTHALYELALNHDGVAQLAKTNESKIHKLQQELSKANRRIEELEGVM